MNKDPKIKNLESDEDLDEVNKSFFEFINEKQAAHINSLEREITFLRDQNAKLVDKLLGVYKKTAEIDLSSMNPIEGYTPLRERIKQMEMESSRKAREEQENAG